MIMEKQTHHFKMQLLIGNLLRVGVFSAAIVVLYGGCLYLIHSGHQSPAFGTFGGEPAQLTHISGILSQAMQGNSAAIIQAGLLLLIFTPIARVGLSLVLFALEKDRLYFLITLIVIGLLLYSLLEKTAA